MNLRFSTIFIVLALAAGCQVPQENRQDPLFDKINSDHSGITFSNDLNHNQLNIIDYLYYYNGGGVAVGDINNDGLVDLFFTANEGENKLYLNKGDFKFEDITLKAGVPGKGDWSTGVTMADVNNDGLLDIYVCYLGDYKSVKGSNELYINNGDLTFSERSKDYGLNFTGFSTHASFFDYDQDGDLDVYLLNNSVHSVNSYGSSSTRKSKDLKAGDRLYKNLSKEGENIFVDVTEESGIYSSLLGYGLGVAVSDINLDGLPDIYVTNDFHENDYLYFNNGDGTFSESLEQKINHTTRYSMGVDIGDLNADGWPDIVTLDMIPDDPEIFMKSAGEDRQEVYDIKQHLGYSHQFVKNALQLNQKGKFFSEISQMSGIYATDWSWSALIGDLNNDTQNDIFITNGIYRRPNDLDYIQYLATLGNFTHNEKNKDSIDAEMIRRMPQLKIPNYAFTKDEELKFTNRSEEWGLNEITYSNGAAYADLDNDGDLDLIINNVNDQAFIYRNNSNEQLGHHFIQVELQGNSSNKNGVGAKVAVYYDSGKAQVKEIMLSRGFLSSVAPMLHFGMANINKVDSLEVYWPGGKYQVIHNPSVDQRHLIQQDQGLNDKLYYPSSDKRKLFTTSQLDLPFRHKENTGFKDYSREHLIPYLLSTEGPALAISDVNGDGLDDIYIGGAKGQAAVLFIQNSDGEFQRANQPFFLADTPFEDVDAVFFDADNDGDQDLYVVSGGNEHPVGHSLLADRLYLNSNGKGSFVKGYNYYKIKENGAVVRPLDYDMDGNIDLFIGSRSVPGTYGKNPKNYILRNTEKGLVNVTKEVAPQLSGLGMVTDAGWGDYDNDGDQDLIIIGEWIPLTILKNDNGKFSKVEISSLNNSSGWWQCLKLDDIDDDGDIDIIAGNFGENTFLKPDDAFPLVMRLADYDKNNQSDPLIFYYKNGSSVPLATKDQLSKQLPAINKRFTSYEDYSKKGKTFKLLNENNISVVEKKAQLFSSGIFYNDGNGEFRFKAFPVEAQMSSVEDIHILDLNKDGKKDLYLVGNFFGTTVNLGRNDAMAEIALLARDHGFEVHIPENVENNKENRKIRAVKIGGINHLIMARNNDSLKIIKLEQDVQ